MSQKCPWPGCDHETDDICCYWHLNLCDADQQARLRHAAGVTYPGVLERVLADVVKEVQAEDESA